MNDLHKIRFLLTPAERKGALLLLALMFVGMTLEALCTGLVIPAIALLTQRDLTDSYPQLLPLLVGLGNPTKTELVFLVMLGMVSIYLIKNLFLAYLGWQQTRFVYNAQAHLSQRLFATYLRQPYTFHLQRNSAQLIRNASGEVGNFAMALGSMLNLLSEVLVLFGISVLLLAVEPVGALMAALVLGGAAWAFHRGTRARITRWGELRLRHDRLSMQYLMQGLGGAKEVKLLGREHDFLEQYRSHNLQRTRVGQFQATLQLLPRLWLELLAVLSLATLVSAMLVQGKDIGTIVPTLGLFAAGAFRLLPSVNRVLAAVQALRYCAPSLNALQGEIRLENQPLAQPRPSVAPRSVFRHEISLAEISYTYPGAAASALSNLSMRIRKGEAVGLVGPSGSGKSTLVDIVLGLLTPAGGRLTVDGEDIHLGLRAWQDQLGYVPQSIYLTDDTLRRNVAFGLSNPEIDEAAVLRAVRAAQLDEFVASLPQGLDTVVGERGIRLSGGQRQRIGIARALYHDPAVLVLDEATSALDTATERGVMRAVSALHGEKTILIVAHRLSTVEQCDRLYRLEQGRVAAEGSPAEILRLAHAV